MRQGLSEESIVKNYRLKGTLPSVKRRRFFILEVAGGNGDPWRVNGMSDAYRFTGAFFASWRIDMFSDVGTGRF